MLVPGTMMELCRIASEVRVFPLLELNSKKSRHLEQVVTFLEKAGIEWQIERVP